MGNVSCDVVSTNRIPFCIGDSYGFLGRFEDALSSFEKALEIRERILPPGDKRIERCREYIRRAENAINPDE